MSTLGTRLCWHGASGLGMGAACTIATLPFTAGRSPGDVAVAVAMLVCSTLLCGAVTLATASVEDNHRAMVLTGFLAPVGGVVNATATYMLSRALQGQDPTDELGLVMIFGIPYGGAPGCLYALPLVLAVAGARRALDLPRGTTGAGGRLLLWIAGVAVATAATVRASGGPYPVWPVVWAGLAVLSVLCGCVALRDLWTAARLRGAAALEALPRQSTDALEGVDSVAPPLASSELDTVVWAPSGERGDGPYRASTLLRPIFVLTGPPGSTARRLEVGAVLLLALALALAALG